MRKEIFKFRPKTLIASHLQKNLPATLFYLQIFSGFLCEKPAPHYVTPKQSQREWDPVPQRKLSPGSSGCLTPHSLYRNWHQLWGFPSRHKIPSITSVLPRQHSPTLPVLSRTWYLPEELLDRKSLKPWLNHTRFNAMQAAKRLRIIQRFFMQ